MLATFTVTNTNDAPENTPAAIGTLRQAIFDANDISLGPDTITFDPTVFDPTDGVMDTIVLTEGQLTITDALTINGPGWDELTIDASGTDTDPMDPDASRVFNVTGDLSRMNAAA